MKLNKFKDDYKQFDYDSEHVREILKQYIQNSGQKIIVLDDDPTGIQTVHQVPVFTDWSKESIRSGFEHPSKVFFILTNSRGLTEAETTRLHIEVAENIQCASRQLQQKFILISRGDSTLRGHYPLETRVLVNTLESSGEAVYDGEILIPYFKEGGRFTIDDIHYVKIGEVLIPAGETEFARDKTFGYQASNLSDYIEEKTGGKYRAEDVVSIGLDDLKAGDYQKVCRQLMEVKHFNKVIVNAMDDEDIEVFCTGLYMALSLGKKFIFRTAASFVRVAGGISQRPLLSPAEMKRGSNSNGGLVIIGSHTAKTTQQLEQLKLLKQVQFLEFNSDLVLEDKLDEEAERVTGQIAEELKAGKTVAVYTKRRLLTLPEDTKEAALRRSVKISEAVCSLVGNLSVEPSFIVAKGGITSSDIGVRALKVKQAEVLGQIQPGIPVWKTDTDSRFPGIPYIIFPGNVGDEDTLKKAVELLIF